MSVENQEIVKIETRLSWDEKNTFCRIHLDGLQEAMNNLKGETLKLWLYLNKNANGYQLELSPAACRAWGLKKDAYYTAKEKLKELGYLTPKAEGSNIYIFHEFAVKHSEKQNDNTHSEKQNTHSGKQNTHSEKPTNHSGKAQRNTITLQTLKTQGEDLTPFGVKSSNRVLPAEEEFYF